MTLDCLPLGSFIPGRLSERSARPSYHNHDLRIVVVEGFQVPLLPLLQLLNTKLIIEARRHARDVLLLARPSVAAVRVAAASHAAGHGHAAGAARRAVRGHRVADQLAVDLEGEVGAAVVDVLDRGVSVRASMGWGERTPPAPRISPSMLATQLYWETNLPRWTGGMISEVPHWATSSQIAYQILTSTNFFIAKHTLMLSMPLGWPSI